MIGIERKFSDNTRLIDLAVEDLKILIVSLILEVKQVESPQYVYGYKGLADLLQCSLSKAQSIKMSGKIDKAIIQTGRKIIVDANLVLTLLKKAENS